MLIFVYGSLMRGLRLHSHMGDSSFVGERRTPACYWLYDLGMYPAMVFGGPLSVRGELYDCPQHVVDELDAIEGHPRFYVRTELVLEGGDMAHAYLLPRHRPAELRAARALAVGSWREHVENGSDVAEEREEI